VERGAACDGEPGLSGGKLRIAVFGGTGVTGRLVIERAISEGHDVIALTRDRSRLSIQSDQLDTIEGSPTSPADVRRVLEDVDAVIHCLGIGGKGDGKESTVVSDSVRLVIAQAGQAGVKRIVCMSNVGAGGSGPWLYRRIVLPIFLPWLRPIIADKDRMEELLRANNLEWISIRLPNIVDGPSRPIRASADGSGVGLSITAASVAAFLVDQVGSSEWVGKTPSISN
jgi:uncharacterized protein YbjT (DUF2867 family)